MWGENKSGFLLWVGDINPPTLLIHSCFNRFLISVVVVDGSGGERRIFRAYPNEVPRSLPMQDFFEILKLLRMGMVFIIGKSGSGKSTLLNVLKAVGLDKYDQRYPDELSGGHIVSDFTKYCDVILQIMLKNIEKYVII